jgi:hypothetical protein
MISGIEKLIRHFIDGKEYSPGLIIKIVNVNIDEVKNIKVVFDLENEGDVPYNLIIVGTNLQNEINKYIEYLSLEDYYVVVSYVKQNTGDIFYAYGDVPFKDIMHLTNSFKSELLHNLQDIQTLRVSNYKNNNIKIIGKFIPKIYISTFKEYIYLNITFMVKEVDPNIEYDVEELIGFVDEEFIESGFGGYSEYLDIQNAVTETYDKWDRNFQLDNPDSNLPSWMNENFRIFIDLV